MVKIVVPWHNPKQKHDFLEAWKVRDGDPRLILQQDTTRAGCARTKNAGIARAVRDGADIIIVLDDDCYPATPHSTLDEFIEDHAKALEAQKVQMVVPTMLPHPRGFPYQSRHITMPTAASIGLWVGIPDLDAMSQLVLGAEPDEVQLLQSSLHGVMFPFCGMNFAFRPKDWLDCAQLIDVPRFDDIWMGWIWEKVAYDRGCCFNMNGPLVRHVRQSNVWQNLVEETKYMQLNETLWSAVLQARRGISPQELRKELFGQWT